MAMRLVSSPLTSIELVSGALALISATKQSEDVALFFLLREVAALFGSISGVLHLSASRLCSVAERRTTPVLCLLCLAGLAAWSEAVTEGAWQRYVPKVFPIT